jgi:uncharacterized membrane protein YhaH (DUF805 family)|tara:strand:+ start:403 stop:765 length:363 start_codon:yes stop_codon:yes gene_type:complete
MEYYIKVLKNYANFKGRARRKEYWMFILFNTIINYALMALTLVDPTLAVLSSIYSVAVIIPTLAVLARRMHDVNKSGWFMLIPLYNFILAVTNGDKGENKYGQDPKEAIQDSEDLLDSNI